MGVVTEFNSKQLETLVLAGDLKAFGQLIRLYDADLRSVVWSVVGSRADVDDVMQMSYEKAVNSLDKFEGRSSIKTWLYSICYRTAINHAKYERRRDHESVDAIDVSMSLVVEDQVLATAQVKELFDVLDIEQRGLLMAVYGLGFSFEEAGKIFGMPKGTVASKVGRTKKKLEKRGLL